MSTYNMILSSNESTVVAEYEPQVKRSDSYQSEAALEQAFIKMLVEQGYEYVTIHSEDALIDNLRMQLERLNQYSFTDKEWDSFFKHKIANHNDGIVEKTRKIQEDHVQNLTREDGTTMNISLIDKKNIHNNRLQVMNQYEENGGKHDTRYDVTILVNGLPLVHVELKRRGVALKEAFNQINRYQRDSFWAGSGLYEYVQIFVISNGTNTKYYSNTTRFSHIKENETASRKRSKKTSNSFEFTSFWADGNNRTIPDLVDFTKTFFTKHTLLNILTKYCVFTTEELLLVMRPYQIAATERILNRIETSTNYKQAGTIEAGGYIWHTTGSGKTLTSFKTAQLATNLPYIEKVLFVVDRKDLDYQTIREYDRFEKGAANGNKSTAVLQKQLEDSTSRIIVTTIQKLDVFITKNPAHPIRDKHIVLIFDECHRSQFGDMHTRMVGGTIKKGEKTIKVNRYFRNYHIFGFTGTPIFSVNASSGGNPNLKTTAQAFGGEPNEKGEKVLPLHTYTIVDAINDGNVLPFRIDYINTIKQKENSKDKQVTAIDTEEALASPERISEVVKYALEHFDQKTMRNSYYSLKGQRVNGFNSMFAVSSIPACKKYYLEFKKQEILVAIDKAIKSSLQLRSKKELIENFIETINADTNVTDDWQRFVREQRETDIQSLIAEEKLKPEETKKFVANAFRDGVLKTTGTDVDRILPPVSRFGGGGSRDKKKQTVIEKLKAFFEKYFGLLSSEDHTPVREQSTCRLQTHLAGWTYRDRGALFAGK